MFKIFNFRFRITSLVIVFVIFAMAVSAQQKDTVQRADLQEITIEFTKPTLQTAANSTTISQKQIRAQQGNGSVNNLLELMPSIVTTSDAGNGLGATYMFIRGIDHTHINTTLNGVTINNPESRGSWLVNLPDMGAYLEEISVQNGINSTDGTTLFNSRINFVTKELPDKPFAEIKSSFGSYKTFHNMVSAGTGLIAKRFSMLASFSDIRSDGYVDWSGVRLNSGFMTAQYNLYNFKKDKDYGKLKFNLLFGTEHTALAWSGIPYDSLFTNRTYNPCGEYKDQNGVLHYYKDSKDNYTQTFYQLEYVKDWICQEGLQHHKLQVMPFLTRGKGYYQQYKDDKKIVNYGLEPLYDSIKYADFITQKYLDNYFYGVRAQYVGSQVFENSNKQGVRWTIGVENSNYDGSHYGNVLWAEQPRVKELPCDYQWYFGTGHKQQTKIFSGLRYWYNKFSISTELQYRHLKYEIGGTNDALMDVTQNYEWNFFDPRVSLHYYLSSDKLKHSFDLSFSFANNEATRDALIGAPDDRKPKPERLYNLEFSYLMHNEKFFFNTTFYGMYYRDQLVRTGEIDQTGDALLTNIDKSYRAGVEISTAYRPVKFFTWHFNSCFSLNKNINYVNYLDDWDNGDQIEQHLGNTPLAFSPSIILGNDFTFTPLKDFNISFITKFVSKQFIDNSGDDTYCLKPYSYSNLRLSYTFHFKCMKDLELFFYVNNIFNAKYESNAWIYTYSSNNEKCYDTGYFPQAGINFLGGLRIKF